MAIPLARVVDSRARPSWQSGAVLGAVIAGVIAAGALLATGAPAPVPRADDAAFDAAADVASDTIGPRGGVRVRWRPDTGHDGAWLARRLERRGISATVHEHDGLVIADLPGIARSDTLRAVLIAEHRVEVHELLPDGGIGAAVLLDDAAIAEVVVTSHLSKDRAVVMLFERAMRPRCADLVARFHAGRLAVTVDGAVRWTPRFAALFPDEILYFIVDDREIDGLAAALRGGAMSGGTVVDTRDVPGSGGGARPLDAMRFVSAMLGGLAVGVLAGLFLRAARAVVNGIPPSLRIARRASLRRRSTDPRGGRPERSATTVSRSAGASAATRSAATDDARRACATSARAGAARDGQYGA